MKIANKISLSFLAVGLILTSIAASFFYLIAKDALQKSIYKNLDTAVASRTDHIGTYLEMLEASVGQLSKSVVLENLLKVNGKEDSGWRDAFEVAMKRLVRTKEINPAIAEFLLMDKTGKAVASSNESNVGLDKSTDSIFLGGQKETYIKDAYYSEVAKEPLMAVSTPFLDSQTGELLGVLAARVTLDKLNSIVVEKTGMGDTGEIYIVNKYGFMVTPVRFKKDVVLKQRVDTENVRKTRLHKGREHILSKKKRIDVFPDYRGVQVLGAHEYIPQMQWTVLAEIDAKEALAPLAKLRLIFFLTLLIVPITAWLLGISLAKLITGSLHKLHKGTEVIGSGNLDYKIGTNAKDEVGQLSRAFDAMTANLKTSTTSIESLNKEIAERKKAEDTLRENEERFKAIFDHANDGIILADEETKNFYIGNNTICQMLGYSLEEIKKLGVADIHPREDLPYVIEQFQRQVRREIAVAKDLPVKRKDGGVFYADVNTSLVTLAGKTYLLGIFRDITERKQAEGALVEAMKVKSDFTSTVSHELRTPLTAIKEGIAIVLDGTTGALNAEQKDFLSLAKRNVDRLARLINDVLDFQKLEAQKMVFNIQENDINALVREVHNTMAPLTGKKGLGFLLQLEEGLPQVKFDRDRIEQVLTNLVNNAIKFTQNGSIVIASSRGDNIIRVSVKDSGPGIKVEDMGRLFQQFWQLEKITERKTGGTGLGLAISKEIIEKHKGRIWVESPPAGEAGEFGKGTTFWFSLPVKAKDKVLVIDDDKVILDIIKNLLEKKGYGVTCSEKGWDAIEIIGRDKPDLVILDMILKDISGFEIIGRLRSNKDTLKVPIIAMSGHPEELIKIEDRQEELALVSISKPFDLENLLSIARKLLQQRF
jgi:PAS domain S-box-containing protein